MNSSIGLSTPVLKAYEETGRSSIPLDFHWSGRPSLSRGLPSIAENSTKVRVEKLEGLDSGQVAMDHTRSGSDLFVRIDPGEEIHEALQRLADKVGFDAAAITSGIGRTRDNLYGFMDGDGVGLGNCECGRRAFWYCLCAIVRSRRSELYARAIVADANDFRCTHGTRGALHDTS